MILLFSVIFFLSKFRLRAVRENHMIFTLLYWVSYSFSSPKREVKTRDFFLLTNDRVSCAYLIGVF